MTFAATIKTVLSPHHTHSSLLTTVHTSYSCSRLLGIRPRSTMDRSSMRRLIFSFVMMLLLAVEIHATIVLSPAPQPQPPNTFSMYGATPGSLHPQECGTRCTTRCSKTAFKKPCMFFCQKCCAKCLCVPPGTYGNKQLCPCYNNWKTKRGGPKCP